jgi:signal peptidase I
MEIFKRLGAFFLDMLEVVVFAVAIFLFLYLLVVQPHKIKGASMEPNYPDGEFLLTDKLTYRFGEPKRGDVIVFKAPVEAGDEYIKRIIGLPGDTVSVKNNNVFVNGNQLDEAYLASTLPTSGGYFLTEGASVTVPQGSYFVMGDNRPYSSDSRSWGFVTKDKITGRAWFIYWPPQKAGFIKETKYSL